MRVLVIDDQEDAAFLLCQLVKSRACESRYCTVAVQAIDVARAWQPEVILLDLRMPGMDGYSLAPMLRAAINGAAPRIILVSGYLPDHEKLAAAAIDDYLLKPVRLQEMTELLHSQAVNSGQAPGSGVPYNLASIFLPVDPALFRQYLQEWAPSSRSEARNQKNTVGFAQRDPESEITAALTASRALR